MIEEEGHVRSLHDDGDKDGRAPSLEHDVGQGLKDGIGHEEQSQSLVVLGHSYFESVTQAGDVGIADIGSIQEGQQIQTAKLQDS